MDPETQNQLTACLSEIENRYVSANPLSARQHEQARRSLPGGNTRSTIFYEPFPVTFARGEGAHLWDIDGHRYLNLVSEYTAGLFGHAHPALIEAARRVLSDGMLMSGPTAYEAQLAEAICLRFPSCAQMRFCNSGSEANLLAVAAARRHTGRPAILVFRGSYHGGFMTYGDPPSPLNVPFETIIGSYNDIAGTRQLLVQNAERCAAVLVEPMMGAAGCIPATWDFLASLRHETQRHRIVLIFDEVMTSRLGHQGLQGSMGLRPDMTTLGKYLGGGFSFGAFGGAAEIMQLFDNRYPASMAHGGTFNNNVMSMAAGLAGARELTAERIAHLNSAGDDLRGRINEIFAFRQLPMTAIGFGSVMNIHFGRATIRRPQDIDARWMPLRRLLHLFLLLRGYHVASRGMLALSLPMTVTDLQGVTTTLEEFCADYGALLRKAIDAPATGASDVAHALG